jgi:hypothetical protein
MAGSNQTNSRGPGVTVAIFSICHWPGLLAASTSTVRLPLEQASEAYELAADGQTGKACIVFDE